MHKMRTALLLLLATNFACHNSILPPDADTGYAPAGIFQLSPPQHQTDSTFFKSSTTVVLALDFPEATLRYTTDGTEVTPTSTPYHGPLLLDHTAVLQASAFHPECQASEPLSQKFFKVSPILDNANWQTDPLPDYRYPGNGALSLSDGQKGDLQFRDDRRWLGFQKDTVDIDLLLPEKRPLKSLTISTIANEIAWVFLPNRIELVVDNNVITTWSRADYDAPSRTDLHFLTLRFPEITTNSLTLRVLAEPLPKGHNGYGYVSWFFVDEVFSMIE